MQKLIWFLFGMLYTLGALGTLVFFGLSHWAVFTAIWMVVFLFAELS